MLLDGLCTHQQMSQRRDIRGRFTGQGGLARARAGARLGVRADAEQRRQGGGRLGDALSDEDTAGRDRAGGANVNQRRTSLAIQLDGYPSSEIRHFRSSTAGMYRRPSQSYQCRMPVRKGSRRRPEMCLLARYRRPSDATGGRPRRSALRPASRKTALSGNLRSARRGTAVSKLCEFFFGSAGACARAMPQVSAAEAGSGRPLMGL